jgi:hypothetical protein
MMPFLIFQVYENLASLCELTAIGQRKRPKWLDEIPLVGAYCFPPTAMIKTLLIPVAVAARLLSASEGTIATWLDEGLLKEWERAPKRRIVDARQALLLCGLRHDLQQVTPEIAAALDLRPGSAVDAQAAARIAVTYSPLTGLPEAKLAAAISRYLSFGYEPAEIEECLARLGAYRAQRMRSAPAPSRDRIPAHVALGHHQDGLVQVDGRAAVGRYHHDPVSDP